MIAAKMDAWMPAMPVAAASRRAPGRGGWGFAMGWRGFETFSRLNALTDSELAAQGLSRADLPRLALAAMKSVA